MFRLVGGDVTNEGRVEVYCSEEWGTVCRNALDLTVGGSVCRQLGYDLANQVNYVTLCVSFCVGLAIIIMLSIIYLYRPGNSSSSIWSNDLFCSSTGSNCIAECQGCLGGAVPTCVHADDATVKCG